MISQTLDGRTRITIELDEYISREMPRAVMEIASAQIAAELVGYVGKGLIQDIDAEELKTLVIKNVSDTIAAEFHIGLKDPSVIQKPLNDTGV